MPKLNNYRCPGCKSIQQRISKAKTIRGYCSIALRSVVLRLVAEKKTQTKPNGQTKNRRSLA
jgi:hypothetical protein